MLEVRKYPNEGFLDYSSMVLEHNYLLAILQTN